MAADSASITFVVSSSEGSTITIGSSSTAASPTASSPSPTTSLVVETPPALTSTIFFTVITTRPDTPTTLVATSIINPDTVTKPRTTGPSTVLLTTTLVTKAGPTSTVTESFTEDHGILSTDVPASRSHSFSRNTGAILGVTFGTTIALVFIGLWIFFAYRTQKRRQLEELSDGSRQGIIDFAPRPSHSRLDDYDDDDGDDGALGGGGEANGMSERYDGILAVLHLDRSSRRLSHAEMDFLQLPPPQATSSPAPPSRPVSGAPFALQHGRALADGADGGAGVSVMANERSDTDAVDLRRNPSFRQAAHTLGIIGGQYQFDDAHHAPQPVSGPSTAAHHWSSHPYPGYEPPPTDERRSPSPLNGNAFAPTFNDPRRVSISTEERSAWLGGNERQAGYHGTSSPTSSHGHLNSVVPAAYGHEQHQHHAYAPSGNGRSGNADLGSRSASGSDQVGLVNAYYLLPSTTATTRERYSPSSSGRQSPMHNDSGRSSRQYTLPPTEIRSRPVSYQNPPTSFAFKDSGRKRFSADGSLKALFGRFRSGGGGDGASSSNGEGAGSSPSVSGAVAVLHDSSASARRMSVESSSRADSSSRATSRLFQHSPVFPLKAFLRPSSSASTTHPPSNPAPPPPADAQLPAHHPFLHTPATPPSPAGTETSGAGGGGGGRGRGLLLEGLLDPRLTLRLGESGQRSLTSFVDHEDYTRRIGAFVHDETRHSVGTFDTQSVEGTVSEPHHYQHHHHHHPRTPDSNARTPS